jgi:hypothetical protein
VDLKSCAKELFKSGRLEFPAPLVVVFNAHNKGFMGLGSISVDSFFVDLYIQRRKRIVKATKQTHIGGNLWESKN